MFSTGREGEYIRLIDGISIKTLVYGEKTLTAEFKLTKGSRLPLHSHHHEQTGYMISGKMRFVIGEKSYLAEAGSSWCIAGHEEHGAEVLEDSVVIEVFAPMREDYLPEILKDRQ